MDKTLIWKAHLDQKMRKKFSLLLISVSWTSLDTEQSCQPKSIRIQHQSLNLFQFLNFKKELIQKIYTDSSPGIQPRYIPLPANLREKIQVYMNGKYET